MIVTQSGNKFAKSETDWKWWDPCVPRRLKTLHDDGFVYAPETRPPVLTLLKHSYQVVIFTNQGGVKAPKKESANLKKFKLKVAAIFEALDLPLVLYAATEDDKFRKPRPGMWDEMKDDFDLDVHGVDLTSSYLVGDAAGREGDFSDSDRCVYSGLLTGLRHSDV